MYFKDNAVKLLSSFFGVGYLPLVPGTFGSLAGVFLFYCAAGSRLIHLWLALLMAVLGFLVSGKAERVFNKKDPKFVVIDEVAGMLVSLLFLPFYDPWLVAIGFLLFRILDTLKPFPAGCLQEIKGSIGIMSDDLVAGLYTNIMLQLIARFALLNGS
ncbi:MAG: phosphatidylglycerophosphatase A [Candidatus Omnitrophota bacterium]|nr:phosphatidylglycerophosphatase A [Candidatus Omnitrophota bacterium]